MRSEARLAPEIRKFDYEDSNFRSLLVNRLDDARREEDEGCAFFVSAVEGQERKRLTAARP